MRQLLEDQRGVEPRQRRAADVFLDVNAAEAERRRLAQRLDREGLVLVPVARMRHHFVARELPRGRLEGALFFGEGKVHGAPCPLGLPSRRPRPATGWNIRAVSGSNEGAAAREAYDGAGRQEAKRARPHARASPHPILPKAARSTGRVGDDEVVLVRHGGKVSAIAAHCTHYHGPLAEGLVVGDTIRCPWHHACFDLATGEALAAPALSPLSCWRVEERGGKIVVGAKQEQPAPKPTGSPTERIVIVGGGAAGFACGRDAAPARLTPAAITMLSNDNAAPVDRPNLSKDYLAGTAPEDWVPLRGDDWYAENKIDLKLKTDVTALDAKAKNADARRRQQDRLRQTAAGDRRRAGETRHSRRRPGRTSTRCARSPTAAPSSRRRKPPSARW